MKRLPLVFVLVIGMASHASSQTLLQRCIGVVPGQEPKRTLGESPQTMTWCQQLPAWGAYEQARQRFEAGDHAGGARFLLQAAQGGNALAQIKLALMYGKGDGVPSSAAAEIQWLQAAALLGEPASQAILGTAYEYGQSRGYGIADDWDQAAKLWQASAAQGWSIGEYCMGRAYEYGIGVPLNLQDAIFWYDKAAAQGHSQAAYFAKYLRDNHGLDGSSRDDDERSSLGPLAGRILPFTPPIGTTFHHLAERQTFVSSEYRDQERAKAQANYEARLHQYRDCRTAGGSNCVPPPPAPK